MTDIGTGVDTWWGAITAGFSHQQPLEPGLLTLALVVGAPLIVTLTPALWRFFGLFVTVVHELGHAFAALMTGRIVKGISLNFDHSGQMNSFGRRGFSAHWAGFWGYPAPAVVGLALITSAIRGWAPAAMSIGALVLLLTLLFIRNAAGVVIALSAAVLAQVIVVFIPAEWIAIVVAGLGCALTIGAIKDLVKVIRVHTRGRNIAQSDAFILAQGSRIPAAGWLFLFALVILGCAAVAASGLYRVFAPLAEAV